jgi:hypothetical protein
MGRVTNLLLIIGLSLPAGCSRAPSAKVTESLPVNEESSASVVPVSDINLASIGSIAAKGRVQDGEYNDLAVVKKLIQQGKEAVPYCWHHTESNSCRRRNKRFSPACYGRNGIK